MANITADIAQIHAAAIVAAAFLAAIVVLGVSSLQGRKGR